MESDILLTEYNSKKAMITLVNKIVRVLWTDLALNSEHVVN